jgi:hypothetical protein
MYKHISGLNLRKIQKSDFSDLLRLKKENWWGANNILFFNNEDQIKWHESMPDNELVLIAEKEKPICVFLYSEIDFFNRKLSISGANYKDCSSFFNYDGFCAALDFAFEMLNMNRVEFEILECHLKSKKIETNFLEMKIEGKKRKEIYKCGEYYDSIVFGFLRKSWKIQERFKKHEGICGENY